MSPVRTDCVQLWPLENTGDNSTADVSTEITCRQRKIIRSITRRTSPYLGSRRQIIVWEKEGIHAVLHNGTTAEGLVR